jgi:salicylate hydroxylase
LAIEDSAVLAELIADEHVQTVGDLEAAFSVFNDVRKERGQALVTSSRRQGDLYERRAEGVEDDFKKIEEEINKSNDVIAKVNVRKMCREAKEMLAERLASTQSRSRI